MAALTGEGERRGVIPKALERENDYFLAKWFWLEFYLNLRCNFKQILKTQKLHRD